MLTIREKFVDVKELVGTIDIFKRGLLHMGSFEMLKESFSSYSVFKIMVCISETD